MCMQSNFIYIAPFKTSQNAIQSALQLMEKTWYIKKTKTDWDTNAHQLQQN